MKQFLISLVALFLLTGATGRLTISGRNNSVPVLTHIQAQGAQWFGGSGTTESAPALTVTAGHLLAISVGWGAGTGASITAISGNGNTYTLIDAATHGTAGAISTYYVKNTASGSTTVQVTWSADPGFGFITVHEVAGASITAPLDQHQISAAAIPTAGVVTSGSVTTGTSGQYVFGAALDESAGATITAGAGFTIPTNANRSTLGASEYQIQSAAGSIAATFAETGSDFGDFQVAIATFK